MDASHDESRIVYMKVHVTLTQKEGKEERERMVMKRGEKRGGYARVLERYKRKRARRERERCGYTLCVSASFCFFNHACLNPLAFYHRHCDVLLHYPHRCHHSFGINHRLTACAA